MEKRIFFKVLAIIWLASGLVILAGVFWPIVSYQPPRNESQIQGLVDPLPAKQPLKVNESLDYTKASNWFLGGVPSPEFYATKVSFYNLSIPKLKIENAIVAIGGEDLTKNLIQYPGTALPGKMGNSVIFGHSVLPIFYNPKDYVSIFSILPTLKKNDEIIVKYDGVIYNYKVENLFEVAPVDIQVLEQDKTDSFLTLVTCVPPGDPRKPKRLIVRARVVPL